MIKCIVRLDDDDLYENEIGCYLWHRNTDNCSAPATAPGHLSPVVTMSRWLTWHVTVGPRPRLSCAAQCSNLVNIGVCCAALLFLINRQTLAWLYLTPLMNNIWCSYSVCYFKCAISFLRVDSEYSFSEHWTLPHWAIVTSGPSHPPPQLPPSDPPPPPPCKW